MQLSLSLAEPLSGHLSDQGSPAAPTPGDPHHKDSVGKGDSLRPSFLPGVPPRRGQLSSAVGATGDFFRHDVPQLARANIHTSASTVASANGSSSASTSASASAPAFCSRLGLSFCFCCGSRLSFHFRIFGLSYRLRASFRFRFCFRFCIRTCFYSRLGSRSLGTSLAAVRLGGERKGVVPTPRTYHRRRRASSGSTYGGPFGI